MINSLVMSVLFVACSLNKAEETPVFSLDIVRASFELETHTSSDAIVVVVDEDSLVQDADVYVEWFVNGNRLDASDFTLGIDYFVRGDVVEALVYQEIGIERSQSLSLSTVLQNSAAVGTLNVIGTEIQTDRDALVVYSVTDQDQDQLDVQIVWYEQNSSLYFLGERLPAEFTVKEQVWQPVLTIFDGYIESVYEGDLVTIVDSPSEILSVSINPQNPYVSDTLTASIETEDLDNDAVPIFYRWNVEGQIIEQQTLNGADFAKGDSVVVEASQFPDFSESVFSDPVVVLNTTPEIGAAILSLEEVYAEDSIGCTPQDPFDLDGDQLYFSYQWFLNGAPQSTDSLITLSDLGAVYNDVLTCQITASDGESVSNTVMESILVSNTAPEVQSASLSHSEVYVTDSVICIPGVTTDVDGQYYYTFQYQWYKNGTDSVSSMPRTNIGGLFEVGDEVSCRVSASDGFDQGGYALSESVTVVNRPPSASLVEIAPAVVYIDSTLSCTLLDYYDADLNEDQSTVQWLLNGAPVTDATEETWVVYDEATGESLISIDDLVTCEIQPSDGIETLPTLTVSKTVVNKPPEVLVGYISPAQPSSTSPVSIYAVTQDVDGDEVTLLYDWYLNGQLVGNESSLPADMLERGDRVQAQITPVSNGVDGVSYLTDIVDVGNGYPYPADPVIHPVGAREGIDDLVCSSLTEPADPDGDPTVHTYSWQVNGNWTMYTVDTIPATELQAGDVWVCLITATDEEGAARSNATYTIIRRPEPLWAELYEFDPIIQLFADTKSDSVPQYYTVRDNRDCWAQEDIWSSLEIDSFRSLRDLEAVEVEFTVYSSDTTIDLAMWGNDFSSYGIENYLSVWLTEEQSSVPSTVARGDWYLPFTTSGAEDAFEFTEGFEVGIPHTLRIETDQLLEKVTVFLDQSVVYQGTDLDIVPPESPKFYLRSISPNAAADVCWHSAKLFEGNP